jgi:demethylsterigmatocystin 6-O-methyltransferase
MGNAAPDSSYLIEQLKSVVQHPEILSQSVNESQRLELQRLTRLASVALETPPETTERVIFAYLPLVTARISNDYGILAALSKGSEAEPVPLTELVKTSGLDRSLVSSIMDYHCYEGCAIEPRQGFYAPTKLTHNMTQPDFIYSSTTFHDMVGPGFGALHRLLKKGPDQPGQKTAFQVGHHTTNSFYDWVESRPDVHEAFYGYMAGLHSIMARWINSVNFDEDFARNLKDNEVVFVDVGGGDGGQCLEVQKAHKLGGKIILQDRSVVIDKATKAKEAGIECMVHDFFTEQPVKGARVYCIQFCLLNWNDEDCVRILSAQTLAMGPDSVLLISDYVQGLRWENEGGPLEADLFTPAVALSSHICHGAKGRSRLDYQELLKRAGLELKEVKALTSFGQALIIAKKP